MTAKLKETLYSPKGGVLAVILLAVLVFVYFQLEESLVDLWPGASEIENEIDELKRSQKRLRNMLNETHELDMDKISFLKQARGYWIEQRDGNIETMAQTKIKSAAKSAGLNLSSVGRVTSSKIYDGIFFNDIPISAKGQIKELGSFITNIYNSKPRMHWHRLTIRPDNVKAPKLIILNGQLRFISITDEELLKMILK